ncbi:hypothetical protein [Microbacterium sp. NPDC055683]
MRRWLSATYRADLESLEGLVSAADHAELVRRAEQVQQVREYAIATDEELDRAIQRYVDFRARAVLRGASS